MDQIKVMIKKLILSCLTLLLLIQPSFSDEEEDIRSLLDKKNDLSGEEFYNELTKLQDQWAFNMLMQIQETDDKDSKLKEQKTSSALEYALDFICVNDCKLYKSMPECKMICMVPKTLIDNSSILW